MKSLVGGIICILMLGCAVPATAAEVSLRSAATAPFQLSMVDSLEIPISDQDRIRLKGDLQLIAREEVAGEKKWQRKKSAKVAVLSNMILPGLGQVYNGRRLKAAIMVGVASFYMGEAWLNYKRSVTRLNLRDRYAPDTREYRFNNSMHVFHKESAKDYLWWSGAAWIIGMLDAYIDAHLFDLRGYVPESENRQASYMTLSMSF